MIAVEVRLNQSISEWINGGVRDFNAKLTKVHRQVAELVKQAIADASPSSPGHKLHDAIMSLSVPRIQNNAGIFVLKGKGKAVDIEIFAPREDQQIIFWVDEGTTGPIVSTRAVDSRGRAPGKLGPSTFGGNLPEGSFVTEVDGQPAQNFIEDGINNIADKIAKLYEDII